MNWPMIILSLVGISIGYIGYKLKKWSFKVYYFGFSTIFSFFLVLGVLPYAFPDAFQKASLVKQVLIALVISLAGGIISSVWFKKIPKNIQES